MGRKPPTATPRPHVDPTRRYVNERPEPDTDPPTKRERDYEVWLANMTKDDEPPPLVRHLNGSMSINRPPGLLVHVYWYFVWLLGGYRHEVLRHAD